MIFTLKIVNETGSLLNTSRNRSACEAYSAQLIPGQPRKSRTLPSKKIPGGQRQAVLQVKETRFKTRRVR